MVPDGVGVVAGKKGFVTAETFLVCVFGLDTSSEAHEARVLVCRW